MTIDTSTAAVTRLMDGVTPGKWLSEHRPGPDGQFRTQVFPEGDPDNTIATIHWHSIKTDQGFTTNRPQLGAFIAAARDLVPVLLAERDALTARAEAAEAALRDAVAERDDYADQIANLLPGVNREAVDQRARADALEQAMQDAVKHIQALVGIRCVWADPTHDITTKPARAFLAKHTKGASHDQ